VQPLSRTISDDLVKTDKYRCALVRINVRKERKTRWEWEKEELSKFIKLNRENETEITEVPDY
jgi:hypothetical protein